MKLPTIEEIKRHFALLPRGTAPCHNQRLTIISLYDSFFQKFPESFPGTEIS